MYDPMEAFEAWWYQEGQHMCMNKDEDWEDFRYRMTKIAWNNGCFVQQQAMNKQLAATMAKTSYTCTVDS